jgi:hypothetical protein
MSVENARDEFKPYYCQKEVCMLYRDRELIK